MDHGTEQRWIMGRIGSTFRLCTEIWYRARSLPTSSPRWPTHPSWSSTGRVRIAQGIAEHGEAFAKWVDYVGERSDEALSRFEDHYLGRFTWLWQRHILPPYPSPSSVNKQWPLSILNVEDSLI